MADLSREESKRLRAELAEGLGFYPASVAAEDVARYPGADRGAQSPRGSRRARWVGSGRLQVAPWDHLKEERRRADVEARGEPMVADLYE